MGMILSLLLLALPAFAEVPAADVARAKVLFENGTILYDEGSYEAAVAAFREAYDLTGEPLMLYNMASALERMADWQGAIDALDGYRAFAPADEREVLERRIRALESRLEDKRESEAAAAAKSARPQPAVPPPVPVTPERRGPSALQLALFGTGAAGVGVGSTFTVLALGARGDWKGACVEGGDGLLCPASASQGVQRDKTRSLVADVSWGVGLLALGGGVVVSLGGRSADLSVSDLSVSVAPDGVAVGGRW